MRYVLIEFLTPSPSIVLNPDIKGLAVWGRHDHKMRRLLCDRSGAARLHSRFGISFEGLTVGGRMAE